MPPHSSHLRQPLDVGCFGPLKQAYGSFIQSKTQLGFSYIDRLDFLEAYLKAHQEVFKPQNIQSGFSAAGIYSFNPERVLSKLNILLATPTPSMGNSPVLIIWDLTVDKLSLAAMVAREAGEYSKKATISTPFSQDDLQSHRYTRGTMNQPAVPSAMV